MKCRHLTISVFFIWTLISPVLAFQSFSAAGEAPIQIEANHMLSMEKTNSVQFSGDVDAKQGDVRIRCDEMTVFYTPGDKLTGNSGNKLAGNSENKTQQVDRLVCDGNVEVTKGDWLGSSQKLLYLKKLRQVILTGKAKAWQGKNTVSGEKIIYYIDEGRSEVVGGRPEANISNLPKNKSSRVNMTIEQN